LNPNSKLHPPRRRRKTYLVDPKQPLITVHMKPMDKSAPKPKSKIMKFIDRLRHVTISVGKRISPPAPPPDGDPDPDSPVTTITLD
jgi:hypothetical protein